MENSICEIVLVDDELLIRQGIKHYLDWEREGFRIAGEASNGREALSVIDKVRPHIVLTDIVMPVMDGEELTRQIKSLYPEIEVIILSSFGEFDYVRATFQSGVADYILKPKLEESELLEILRKTAARIPALHRSAQASPAKLLVRQAMERLLDGYESALEPSKLKEAFPHEHFCLAGIDLRRKSLGEAECAKVGASLEERLNLLLPSASICVLQPKSGTLLAIVNMETRGTAEAAEALRGLSLEMESSWPDAAFAVSEAYGDVLQTAEAYKNVICKRFQRRFYFPERRVVTEDQLPGTGRSPETFPLNRFAEELQQGRYEEAFGRLTAYVEELSLCSRNDVLEFKSFLTAIIFHITVILVNGKHDVKELDRIKYAYFNEINDALYAADAAECLNAFVEEA